MPNKPKSPPGIIIAGTHSSVGKSSLAIGLMHLLKRQGCKVQPFKVGPDYIDTGHHFRACGNPSYNLDTAMTTPKYTKALFNDAMYKKDFAVVEGVMGLFDGASPTTDKGSTAQIAKLLDLPIILVFDARSLARSAAALIKGFLSMDKKLRFMGVIANNVNSLKHERYLKEAIEHYTSAKLMACLPFKPELKIPSRHLGLIQGIERKNNTYEKWADQIEAHLDLRQLKKSVNLKKINATTENRNLRWKVSKAPKPFRVAIAKDKAFQFIYQDTLELIEHHGGKVVYFSPLKDKKLPDADWIYFPGGYPELHLKTLSKNSSILKDIKSWHKSKKLMVAECGGLMYLGKSIKDDKGKPYKMAGIYNYSTTIKQKKLTLSYRELKASKNIDLGKNLKGHEFHYSYFDGNPEKPLWSERKTAKSIRKGDGFRNLNCFAFYTHIYWGENQTWLKYLLKIVGQRKLLDKK